MPSSETTINVESSTAQFADRRIGDRAASDSRAPTRARTIAALLSFACLSILLFAAWLDPAPNGYGTHTQMGMPDCVWMTSMNLPCPTCGMTTAFAHAADGHLFMSFRTQPAGAMLSILTAMTCLGAGWMALSGVRLDSLMGRIMRPRLFVFTGLLVLGGWFYKILAVRGLLP